MQNSLQRLIKQSSAITIPNDPASQSIAAAAQAGATQASIPVPTMQTAKDAPQEGGQDPTMQYQKDLADKDKEIAQLRTEVQTAKNEAQKANAKTDLLTQQYTMLDKVKQEYNKATSDIQKQQLALEQKKNEMQVAEEQHRVHLEAAKKQQQSDLENAKARMEVETAKHQAQLGIDSARHDAQLADSKAKSEISSVESNANRYLKMVNKARSDADNYAAKRQGEVQNALSALQRTQHAPMQSSAPMDKIAALPPYGQAAEARAQYDPQLDEILLNKDQSLAGQYAQNGRILNIINRARQAGDSRTVEILQSYLAQKQQQFNSDYARMVQLSKGSGPEAEYARQELAGKNDMDYRRGMLWYEKPSEYEAIVQGVDPRTGGGNKDYYMRQAADALTEKLPTSQQRDEMIAKGVENILPDWAAKPIAQWMRDQNSPVSNFIKHPVDSYQNWVADRLENNGMPQYANWFRSTNPVQKLGDIAGFAVEEIPEMIADSVSDYQQSAAIARNHGATQGALGIRGNSYTANKTREALGNRQLNEGTARGILNVGGNTAMGLMMLGPGKVLRPVAPAIRAGASSIASRAGRAIGRVLGPFVPGAIGGAASANYSPSGVYLSQGDYVHNNEVNPRVAKEVEHLLRHRYAQPANQGQQYTPQQPQSTQFMKSSGVEIPLNIDVKKVAPAKNTAAPSKDSPVVPSKDSKAVPQAPVQSPAPKTPTPQQQQPMKQPDLLTVLGKQPMPSAGLSYSSPKGKFSRDPRFVQDVTEGINSHRWLKALSPISEALFGIRLHTAYDPVYNTHKRVDPTAIAQALATQWQRPGDPMSPLMRQLQSQYNYAHGYPQGY